jgi:hypothetical protein
MYMNCSNLTQGLVAAMCNQSATVGADDDVFLINFNDIDKTESTETNNIISNITLKNDKQAYAFQTIGKSLNGSGVSFSKGTYRNTVAQNIWLRIFVKTEAVKTFVNEFISGARVVAVVKNKETGPDGQVKYEAYGWDNGLELNELAATIEMTDGVVYPLNIGSSDTAQEGSLPKSVFITSEAATEAMLAGLITG